MNVFVNAEGWLTTIRTACHRIGLLAHIFCCHYDHWFMLAVDQEQFVQYAIELDCLVTFSVAITTSASTSLIGFMQEQSPLVNGIGTGHLQWEVPFLFLYEIWNFLWNNTCTILLDLWCGVLLRMVVGHTTTFFCLSFALIPGPSDP